MRLLIALAAVSFAILVYIFSFVSVQMKLFPTPYLEDAWRAARAFKEAWEEGQTPPTFLENVDSSEVDGPTPITLKLDPSLEGKDDDLILMQGGFYRLTSHCPEFGCVAWVMNREGEILHTWPIKENVPWETVEGVEGFNTFENIYPTGMILLDDGDLIIAYHGQNTFPFGIGIARLDRNGDLVWKNDRGVHHWLDLGDDGLIYAPAHRLLDSPLRIGDTQKLLRCDDGKVYDDLIIVYDLDGNIVEEFSVLESLVDSDYVGLIRGTTDECDPLHLNHVEVVDQDMAGLFPPAEPGDLLLSLLAIDTVVLIDRETKAVKWIDSGHVIAHHNPLFYKEGEIILFDNQGGHHRRGGSRIGVIDMESETFETIYPPEDAPLDEEFYSWAAGHFVMDDAKERLLLALTFDGTVREIDLESGEVLWEYDNVFDMTTHPAMVENSSVSDYARFQTGGAWYVGRPGFLDTSDTQRDE